MCHLLVIYLEIMVFKLIESATGSARGCCRRQPAAYVWDQIVELGRARLRGLVNLHEGKGT